MKLSNTVLTAALLSSLFATSAQAGMVVSKHQMVQVITLQEMVTTKVVYADSGNHHLITPWETRLMALSEDATVSGAKCFSPVTGEKGYIQKWCAVLSQKSNWHLTSNY